MDEKPLIRRMREDYRFFGSMSVIYGAVFAFCLYRNMSGITLPVCVAVTIAFSILFMKRIGFKMQKRSVPYIVGMMLLGISSAYTSSWFFHFFNMLGIILLYLIFMMHQFYSDDKWNLPGYLGRMGILLGSTVTCIPYFYSHGSSKIISERNKKNYTILAVVIGFVAAIGVLCIVLPLLLHSDMMFSKIFGELLKYINFFTIFGIAFFFIAGTTLCYALFGALCKYNFPEGKVRKFRYLNPVIGITFTGVISVIYVLYCAVRIVSLFGGIYLGLLGEKSYAEYARGGFWELLFVSIINFIMVLVCMYLFSKNGILNGILTVISGCTYIMIFSAGYCMMQYIRAYNLTFLRILVLWFLIVLAFIMGGVIVSIYNAKFPLFRYIMIVVSVMYIAFSFSRVDAFVVKYDIAHTKQLKSDDVEYFINHLSPDAAPEIAQIDLKEVDMGEYTNEYTNEYDNYLQEQVSHYFYDIQQENQGIYFRKANYSRIRAKMAADRYLKEHPGYEDCWWYE